MGGSRTAQLIAVFFTGLFAGLMFTFSWVIEPVLATLSGPEYTRVMQGLIRAADDPPAVPAIVVVGLLAPLVTLYQLRRDRRNPVFRLTLAGWVVFLTGVFAVTMGFNHPLNLAIMSWPVEAPSAEWTQIRDRWHQFNLIRTPAASISFLLFAWALQTHSAAVAKSQAS